MKGPLFRLHRRYASRRNRVLSQMFASLIPAGSRVLDVGCGDGRVARAIMDRGDRLQVEGLEVVERTEVLESYPRLVLIELTRNCNLACPMMAQLNTPGSSPLAIHQSGLSMPTTFCAPTTFTRNGTTRTSAAWRAAHWDHRSALADPA